MNTPKTLKDAIRERVIKTRKAPAFVRNDFADLGAYDQIGRVLKELKAEGSVVRLGYGVYARARKSSIDSSTVPDGSVLDLSIAALRKNGVECSLGRAAKNNLLGLTTQVPVKDVINTGKRRISRELGYGGVAVSYENDIEVRAKAS